MKNVLSITLMLCPLTLPALAATHYNSRGLEVGWQNLPDCSPVKNRWNWPFITAGHMLVFRVGSVAIYCGEIGR
jgi:hypothetical protein